MNVRIAPALGLAGVITFGLFYIMQALVAQNDEVQIEEAIEMFGDMRVDRDAALALPGIEPDWITEDGGIRLRPDYWPDLGGIDGFYMALLRKD